MRDRKQAHKYGLAAEKAAGIYLRCKGYRIVAERYRNVHGEIDILAMRGKTLVAVEVKARRTLEQCTESITPHKQQKIARAVQGLIAGHGKISGLAIAAQHTIRFDVIWIAPWRWPTHIEDAWRM
jgi:putative endonuclease